MDDSHTEREYTEESPFVRLLETQGRVKVLDVLLRRPSTKLSAKQIAELADIDVSTFARNKNVLITLGIITELNEEDSKKYYKLNPENEICKILADAQTKLFRHNQYISDRTEVKKENHIGKILTTEAKNPDGKKEESESPLTQENIDELTEPI